MKPFASPFILLALCLASALVGCRGNLLHSDYADLPHAQWDGQEPLLFDLPVVDEPWEGSLWVGVRTVKRFAYEQVVVWAEVLCDGERVEDWLLPVVTHHADQMRAADLLYEEFFSERMPLRIEAGKHYTLRLTHRMRLNPLDNIASVGFGLQSPTTNLFDTHL